MQMANALGGLQATQGFVIGAVPIYASTIILIILMLHCV